MQPTAMHSFYLYNAMYACMQKAYLYILHT